jgi:hypothetical protein
MVSVPGLGARDKQLGEGSWRTAVAPETRPGVGAQDPDQTQEGPRTCVTVPHRRRGGLLEVAPGGGILSRFVSRGQSGQEAPGHLVLG